MAKVSRCGIRKCFLSHGNARTSWHLNFSRVESPVEKCFLNDTECEYPPYGRGNFVLPYWMFYPRNSDYTSLYKFRAVQHWQTVNTIDTGARGERKRYNNTGVVLLSLSNVETSATRVATELFPGDGSSHLRARQKRRVFPERETREKSRARG